MRESANSMAGTPLVAIVTGAASGIGAATARLLVRQGVQVGLLDRNEQALEALARELSTSGGQVMVFPGDVSDEQAMLRSFDAVHARFGPLDMVVANAGINGVWAPLQEIRASEWDATFAVNVRGTFLTLQVALPHLKLGGASIVVVASVNGSRVFSNAGACAYSASKAAQVALARAAALELAARGVRVNVVCPGSIATAIDQSTDRRGLDTLLRTPEFSHHVIPLTGGKPGAAEEVAALIWFLLSDASRHITGADIIIDGAESLA